MSGHFEQAKRAQALAWRWAAAQFARDPSIEQVERRRKLRATPTRGYAIAMRRGPGVLFDEVRTVHRRGLERGEAGRAR